MADGSKIEWTDATWSPITGCTVVSPGCTNCYAMKLAGTRMKNHPSRTGLTEGSKAGPVWNGKVRFNEQWLDQPLRWRRPRMIFVCAHGDLFHENVPDEWIDKVYAAMALAPHHTFQVLTKRPARAREYYQAEPWDRINAEAGVLAHWDTMPELDIPPRHIWLGVSVEDNDRRDRLDELEKIPAAIRFASIEPMLGPVDLSRYLPPPPPLHLASTYVDEDGIERLDITGQPIHGLNWVIVGGESGPNARPMYPDWVRSIRDQCIAAGVPFLFKQWGAWVPGEEDSSRCGPPHWEMPSAVWQDGLGPNRFDAPDPVVAWTKDAQPIVVHGDEREDFRQKHGAPRVMSIKIGKKRAGRELDGRTWDEMPA